MGSLGMLDPQRFKEALASAPTSVVVVTTLDASGQPRGFTAGSFTSLSLTPPLVLVSLDRRAECHEAFEQAAYFAISVLAPQQEALARLMATRGAEKFAGDHFAAGPRGLPLARDAVASFVCRLEQRHPGGDHSILIGAVEDVGLGDVGRAMVHFRRGFHAVGPAA
jgi:flavin reductase ActVB